MGRSTKKGFYVDESLMRKVNKALRVNDKKPLKTWSRRSTITPDFVGMNFLIYNGKKFLPLFVTENMVGHKLGEFAPTRTFRHHSSSKDKAKQAAMGQKK